MLNPKGPTHVKEIDEEFKLKKEHFVSMLLVKTSKKDVKSIDALNAVIQKRCVKTNKVNEYQTLSSNYRSTNRSKMEGSLDKESYKS